MSTRFGGSSWEKEVTDSNKLREKLEEEKLLSSNNRKINSIKSLNYLIKLSPPIFCRFVETCRVKSEDCEAVCALCCVMQNLEN